MRAIINTETLDDIAEAIQIKTGTSDKLKPNEIAGAIESITSKDGQFFPMNMLNYVLPTMTLTYNGEEI